MAKTKEAKVRRVTKNEERRKPGIFTRLKDQEKLVGYALFEPDAELKDNAGFFEHFSHFDQRAQQTVPCSGEDCPLCADGNQPSTKALTMWYIPDNPESEQIKVFTMNSMTVDDFVDDADDLGGILGRKYRIKRRGSGTQTRYKVTNLNDSLPKKDLKAIQKRASEIDLGAIVDKQLRVQLERLRAVEALEEDDDDLEETDLDEEEEEDEEETPKARRGKKAEEADEDEDEDEEEEEEEDEDEDEEELESESEEEDEDEEEEEDEDEEEEGEPATLAKNKVEIVKVNDKDEIFTVKDLTGKLKKFDLWLPEGMDLDFDDYAKGQVLSVNAAQDAEGDWILTAKPRKAKKK